MDKITKILIISSDKGLRDVLNFCFDGWGYEVFLHDACPHDISLIKKIRPNVIIVDVHSAHKNQLEICHLLKEDFTTSFIPVITLINKRHLRAQLLNLKYGVDDYLIKPPDPLDLRVRVEMAIKRAHYSFYASSLTGLPGGRIIEEVLLDKIKRCQAFAFGYMDIDNFKYFNDVYGYLQGDLVIMHTAYLLYSAMKKHGNKEDFIGHIGGDDFVFMTSAHKCGQISQDLVHRFDQQMRFHYSAEDRKQGFIIARDRNHKVRKIELMSLSVAVITQDPQKSLGMHEINRRIAEIKHYLKGISGSKFMADRRNLGKDEVLLLETEKPKKHPDNYRPLGQILLERKLINPEQLEEALKHHWKRGLVLGEALCELGFLSEDDLTGALSLQNSEMGEASMLESSKHIQKIS